MRPSICLTSELVTGASVTAQAMAEALPLPDHSQYKKCTVQGSCRAKCPDGQCRFISCSRAATASSGSASNGKVEASIHANLEQQAKRLGGSIQGSISWGW
jgi:hypothetical protein